MRVFLGGTCNGSTWRETLIPLLEIEYFNPVVEDWTPECQAEELAQRASCGMSLYVLTPKMAGVYSVAEVVDDSNKRPERTVLVLLQEDAGQHFTEGQWRSMQAVASMVLRNGGAVFYDLALAATAMNTTKGYV